MQERYITARITTFDPIKVKADPMAGIKEQILSPSWRITLPHPLNPEKEVTVVSQDWGQGLGRATTVSVRPQQDGAGWMHPDNKAR